MHLAKMVAGITSTGKVNDSDEFSENDHADTTGFGKVSESDASNKTGKDDAETSTTSE